MIRFGSTFNFQSLNNGKNMKLLTQLVALAVTLSMTVGCMTKPNQKVKDDIVIATFNVSMDASNYTVEAKSNGSELSQQLASGQSEQVANIAEIIQRKRPAILLLNEFDYGLDSEQRINDFKQKYLLVSQSGQEPIDYPYHYVASVNTGVYVMEGVAEKHGYGWFPGHYGMLVLSQYPIKHDEVRTFQHFLWKDMPDNLMTGIKRPNGESWYPKPIADQLRLSSKSHWDVPIDVNGKTVHVLASHPTPPGFDGAENRNGKRNHDEIRFWHDYLTPNNSNYIYDDKQQYGGFKGERFVIMGDLNASPVEGSADQQVISNLLSHQAVNDSVIPTSVAGKERRQDNPYSQYHTASWGLRVDYVVPSLNGINVINNGIFWPTKTDPLQRLVRSRKASSDHRMVWLQVNLQ